MAMKKSVWDMILKVVIAVASALAGVLGANAMNLKRALNTLARCFDNLVRVRI